MWGKNKIKCVFTGKFYGSLLRQRPLARGFFSSQNPLVPIPELLLRMVNDYGKEIDLVFPGMRGDKPTEAREKAYRQGKAAKALAKKLLAWCPADNLSVRMLLGDINLMTGDTQSAMKSYLK